MTVLDDLAKAVKAYSTDQVVTRIVDFSISKGPDVNVNDTFTFRVRVTNQGVLFMKDVRVKVVGSDFAKVKSGSDSDFGDSATSGAFDLSSFNGDHTTGPFTGKATKGTDKVAEDIVTAGVLSWDPDLNNLLRDNSVAGKQEGKLTKEIKSS